MHLVIPLTVSALLFATGLYGVLARRNAVLVLMSVELMFNAGNVVLVAFDLARQDPERAGQSLAVFIVTIAAAEIGLGLAIVLALFRQRGSIAVDHAVDLRERPATSTDGRA